MIGKLLRAGLQSGTIMGIADVSTQILVERKQIASKTLQIPTITISDCRRNVQDSDSYDPVRSLRWFCMGLVLHGPYWSVAVSIIDQKFAGKCWENVVKKTAAAQFFLFPPYLVVLFGILGVLEKNPDVPAKIRSQVPEAFLSGCIYWPFANSINFKVVPNYLRVPYLALSAGIWNSYLSYTNHNKTGPDINDKSLVHK